MLRSAPGNLDRGPLKGKALGIILMDKSYRSLFFLMVITENIFLVEER